MENEILSAAVIFLLFMVIRLTRQVDELRKMRDEDFERTRNLATATKDLAMSIRDSVNAAMHRMEVMYRQFDNSNK